MSGVIVEPEIKSVCIYYQSLVSAVLLRFLWMTLSWCDGGGGGGGQQGVMVCSFLAFLIDVELSACGPCTTEPPPVATDLLAPISVL